MYLIVADDFSAHLAETLDDDDKQKAEAGEHAIFQILNPEASTKVKVQVADVEEVESDLGEEGETEYDIVWSDVDLHT